MFVLTCIQSPISFSTETSRVENTTFIYLFIIDPTCIGLNGNRQESLNTIRSKTATFSNLDINIA